MVANSKIWALVSGTKLVSRLAHEDLLKSYKLYIAAPTNEDLYLELPDLASAGLLFMFSIPTCLA